MNKKDTTLTYIDPLSAAKVSALTTVAIALIFSVVAFLVAFVGSIFTGEFSIWGFLTGLLTLVVAIAFYGLIGFVMGYFYAWIYNRTYEWHGGVGAQFLMADAVEEPTTETRESENETTDEEDDEETNHDA